MAARQLCWPPAILFYRCSLDHLSFYFFSPPNVRGRLADRHQTLPHVRWWPRSIKFSQKFGWPVHLKFGSLKTSKFPCDFAWLWDLIANISGAQQDVVNRKTALQTTDTPAQANLILYTLVRKRRKMGPEFWYTQWTAIRLGIAMHLVLYFIMFMQKCRKWNRDAGWVWILCSVRYCCQSDDIWLLTSTTVGSTCRSQ